MRLSLVRPEEVVDFDTFVAFAKQRTGVPLLVKEYPATRRHIKMFFDQYDRADYQTLVKVIEWTRVKKRRYANLTQLVCAWPYAFRAGYLPECDPVDATDDAIEAGIDDALRQETDATWRRKLITAQGLESKREILEQWTKTRQSLPSP